LIIGSFVEYGMVGVCFSQSLGKPRVLEEQRTNVCGLGEEGGDEQESGATRNGHGCIGATMSSFGGGDIPLQWGKMSIKYFSHAFKPLLIT
jgi:hypothetical protein